MMVFENKKFKLLFAFVALLLAISYQNVKYLIDNLIKTEESSNNTIDFKTRHSIETEIIKSWDKLIQMPSRAEGKNLNIVIGMNTNVDLILSGVELLKKLNLKDTNENLNHKLLKDLREFKECFLHFFHKGSAAERYFLNLRDFDEVLHATKNLKQQWFIGGNAALMAQGISKRFPNSIINLIGPVGPKLRQLLNTNIKVSDKSLIEKDEIHLIMEYKAKEKYENFQTPTANRFIVSHDIYNSRMEMLDDIFNLTSSHNPDITIISGLHLLESQNSSFRQEKLEKFRYLLSNNRSKNGFIHLELASIGDRFLMKSIFENNILQEINSLGLNEQELLFLAYSYENAPHSNYYFEINGQPDMIKIIDILEWTLNKFGMSNENKYSKLSRIHFHCLMYHIIAEIDSSEWSNSVSSLLSGSKIAAKQACGFDFNDHESEKILENMVEFRIAHELDKDKNIIFKMDQNVSFKFNSSNPVIQFKRGNIKFYFTPTLVCKKPVKTVGLGDAISSNGVLFVEYKN